MIYNVYTDGSCNQGADSSANTNGGWAFMVTDIDGVIVFSESDSELNTTNNRAEMLAIIKSVQALSNIGFFNITDNSLIIHCDSAYIVNAFEDGWIDKWKKNGWKNSKGEDVVNQDYWNILIEQKSQYNIKFNKVKRRSNPFAKKVDALAREKMRN
jgi:ribonuclease HI